VPSSNLREFIQASKNSGASDEFLAALLMRRGWPADDVYTALGNYWADATGVAVPGRASSSESAREAFLYLLAFSTLCCWATALGSAMFTFIDHWFPDPVSRTTYYANMRRSVTWQMATLVVAFPIFLLVMRAIVRENTAHPEQLQSGVRKWLTYIALLGTAGTMIGDLICFLNYLLSGEITVRFFFKSAVVMILCGAIFLYYLRSLRSRERRFRGGDSQWHRVFATGSAIVVATVFVIGVTVAGTPGQIRKQEADMRRVEALKQLGYAFEVRYAKLRNEGQTAGMPATLIQLVREARVEDAATRDPQTHAQYEYHVIADTRYELCANFSNADEHLETNGSVFWRHGGGRTCYPLDATKPVPN
jgi:hypothetical protein